MADITKKRKRNADGSKKSSKKVAVEPPAASNLSISLVQDSDEWAPIIGMRRALPLLLFEVVMYANSIQLLHRALLPRNPSP